MAVKPCTSCNQRFREKASSVYAAWMGQGGRLSYRASLCMPCVYEVVAPLIKRSIARGYEDGCDQCGATGKDEYFLMWLNVYLPKREQEAFELMFCPMDRDGAVADFSRIGIRLKERELVSSQGPANERDDADSVPW
jgi:hypothetical protein